MSKVERQIRISLTAVIALLTTAAWLIIYLQVQNMGLLMRSGVPMSLGMKGWADLISFSMFTGTWSVMMVAMMLPSSYPTLLLHRTAYRKQHPDKPGGTFLFAVAYFLTWTATGILFFAAYLLIGAYRANDPQADIAIIRAAGAGLILSGLYQWSPFKMSCLRHCQSPLTFILHHWHDGRAGAFRMGITHGLYCLGCCWGLMLILFVMGIMHLGWMAVIGALILLEKVIPSQRWITRLIGAVFAIMGLVVMLFPSVLASFSSYVML